MPPPPPPQSTPRDHGPAPYVVDIIRVTRQNNNYRATPWTGRHLQLTVMTIRPGEDIGLEVHPDDDQFLFIVEGQGIAQMGPSRRNLNFRQPVFANSAVFIPAGTWHNVTNTGRTPLRLFSIYAPPHHPRGTVHHTKAIAEQMSD
ncbi:MAG: cupin domain-containing protein [Defluviitaleaceae bacterium]|nr:cupin domain-containing protein [Defluviitaleaceae bacterium]